MRGEQLHKLKFAEAFHDTLSMMALLINMTRVFVPPSQNHQIPDHCGLPATRKPNARKTKNQRRRS
jgi:hypothetical protein